MNIQYNKLKNISNSFFFSWYGFSSTLIQCNTITLLIANLVLLSGRSRLSLTDPLSVKIGRDTVSAVFYSAAGARGH